MAPAQPTTIMITVILQSFKITPSSRPAQPCAPCPLSPSHIYIYGSRHKGQLHSYVYKQYMFIGYGRVENIPFVQIIILSAPCVVMLIYMQWATSLVPSCIYIYVYTTTTQCKLLECKYSICASRWKEKHHQCKLQGVKPPHAQVECL